MKTVVKTTYCNALVVHTRVPQNENKKFVHFASNIVYNFKKIKFVYYLILSSRHGFDSFIYKLQILHPG